MTTFVFCIVKSAQQKRPFTFCSKVSFDAFKLFFNLAIISFPKVHNKKDLLLFAQNSLLMSLLCHLWVCNNVNVNVTSFGFLQLLESNLWLYEASMCFAEPTSQKCTHKATFYFLAQNVHFSECKSAQQKGPFTFCSKVSFDAFKLFFNLVIISFPKVHNKKDLLLFAQKSLLMRLLCHLWVWNNGNVKVSSFGFLQLIESNLWLYETSMCSLKTWTPFLWHCCAVLGLLISSS